MGGKPVTRIEVTDEAVEVLRRSMELGGVDTTSGGVRLRAARALGGGMDIQVELADAPIPGETTIETEGVRIFVDPELTRTIPHAVVAVEPQHEMVVVRPAEPTPLSGGPAEPTPLSGGPAEPTPLSGGPAEPTPPSGGPP